MRGLEYLKKSDLKSQEAVMMKMVSKHRLCILFSSLHSYLADEVNLLSLTLSTSSLK